MRKIEVKNFDPASSKTVRDINRRIVLNLIRARQPISRADLARLSGLQRCTVSRIVEQLLADGWIMEGPTGRLPRGRRPTYLRLNCNRMILGIDIRPTATRIGVADLNARFLAQEMMPTATDPHVFLTELTQRVCRIMDTHSCGSWEGIGISVPGRVDPRSHRLVFSANLAWRDVDLKSPIERATGTNVELENAANACALAEVWFGQHSDAVQDMAVVTVSEGIGTGILANGQLVSGSGGFAGEFGHIPLDPNGPACRCGNRGCWEVFASNSAALRYYAGSGTDGAATVTFEDLLALAEQGDVRAGRALEQMARHLGAGLALLATGLAPARIILIGEVTRAWRRLGPLIERVLAERTTIPAPPAVEPADDADQPRLRGAIALVIQKHFACLGSTDPAGKEENSRHAILWKPFGGVPAPV